MGLADDAKDVIFTKQLVRSAVELDLGATILANEDFITNADIELLTIAV